MATLEILINAFLQVLREGDFFRSLAKSPPYDYDDVLGKTEKYINLEEA